MEYLLIGISSHLAFWLLRSRVGVLYRLGTESVGLVDGMLAPGDDDEKLEALEVQTGRVLAVFLENAVFQNAGFNFATVLHNYPGISVT